MAKLNQHRLNGEIDAFIRRKDAAQESYTDADLAYIGQYGGAGGQGKHGAKGEGVLYEFYTPDWVCDLMWEIARHYGFNDETDTVLEPSVATGALIRPAKHYNHCVGFEINPTTARIAELTYPGLTVHRGYFETAFLEPPRFSRVVRNGQTWLPQAPFGLVIGNPPYGIYQNTYSSYFPTERKRLKQIEIFFMYKGLQLLKPNGLLVYLTGSNFLRNGSSYHDAKVMMSAVADLIDAYRLPPVFANSQVPTDILVFRRK